jgi:hypothetical protein
LSRQSGSNLLRNGWLDGLGWKAEDQARWVLNVLTLLGTKYGLRARPILGRTQNNPYIIIYLQHSSTKCFILDTDVTWTLCLLEDWGRLLFVVRDRHLDHFLYFQWFSSHPNPLRNQHIPYVRCPPDVGLSVYNPHFDNVRYIYIYIIKLIVNPVLNQASYHKSTIHPHFPLWNPHSQYTLW